MTRKDYVLIAAAIAESVVVYRDNYFAAEAIGANARFLANRLATDNPRFDRNKFLKACGL